MTQDILSSLILILGSFRSAGDELADAELAPALMLGSGPPDDRAGTGGGEWRLVVKTQTQTL